MAVNSREVHEHLILILVRQEWMSGMLACLSNCAEMASYDKEKEMGCAIQTRGLAVAMAQVFACKL